MMKEDVSNVVKKDISLINVQVPIQGEDLSLNLVQALQKEVEVEADQHHDS
jgi:hypothetical protein